MSPRTAVFFDLHGTLGDVEGEIDGDFPDFTWYANAAEAIRLVNEAGLPAIVVTNQGHIAHGRFTLEQFWTRMQDLERELAGHGARFDAVYCCPHSHVDGCDCYKPRTALVDEACRDFDIDLVRSYVVGDRGDFDMMLAAAIGARAVLVRTGYGEGSLGEFRYTWADVEADYIAEDVLDAAGWIVGHASRFGDRAG